MSQIATLRWLGDALELLDQTKLPGEIEYVTLSTEAEVFTAIRDMIVRGAPAIGVTAAYGLALAGLRAPKTSPKKFAEYWQNQAKYLLTARPTAVNLFWAIGRMKQKQKELAKKGLSAEEQAKALVTEAVAIEAEDREANRSLGENLLKLLKDGYTVLTYCNAGSLATSAYGTALSPIYLAKERGWNLKMYASETRPRLQGASITALELTYAGIDTTLICDNMAAVVMAQGKIDAIITGCDRVAANGDVANKIGTFGLAVLARNFGIPFYVACPTSTIDFTLADGSKIPIEERDCNEIRFIKGCQIAPLDVAVFNPSFDVTPAEYISVIATEKGLVYPPFAENLAKIKNL